jgi:Ca2+:H+ antiporter
LPPLPLARDACPNPGDILALPARHSTAVVVAYKQKMDLALGVALGSSTQIAIFVIPLMVLIGWAIGQPLDLFFGPFPTAVTFLSSLLVFIVVQNGETNWLEGVMLLFSYAFICYAFFYL